MRTLEEWDNLLADEEARLSKKYGKDFLDELNTFIILYSGGLLSAVNERHTTVINGLKMFDRNATEILRRKNHETN